MLTIPSPCPTRLVPFILPLVLFLGSALLGLLVAYDRQSAWARFWWVIAGLVLGIAVLLAPDEVPLSRRRKLSPLRLVFGVLPTAIVAYFLLTNDWSQRVGKVPYLDSAMLWFMQWQPQQPGRTLDANAFGGVLAAFLPLQVAAWRGEPRSTIRRLAVAPLVGVSAAGLLLSASRGAWLALALVSIVWGAWRLLRRLQPMRRPVLTQIGQHYMLVSCLVVLLAVGSASIASPVAGQILSGALSLRPDRLDVWRNSLDLARDYPLTGLGLSGFEMAYSSYVLLVHVPYYYHAHSLLLDIQLQQGILGLLAFVWLVATSVWPGRRDSAWGPAALAATGVVLLHGLADDAFYGYGGTATVLLFVPLALAFRSRAEGDTCRRGRDAMGPVTTRLQSAAVPVLVLILPIALLAPAARSALEANLGAHLQTRAELPLAGRPGWELQDKVRRGLETDLGPAVSRYRAALAIDPANATANRRLGQIELSLGQYEAAHAHLLAAYAADSGQRATRQLLGESYALRGQTDDAAELWQSIDYGQGQLETRRVWYRAFLGDERRAVLIDEAIRRLGR